MFTDLNLKIAFLALVLLIPFFIFQPAYCVVNVAVDTSDINLSESLQPGEFHPLPQITVINSGDQQATFIIEAEVVKVPGSAEVSEVKSWFRFIPSEMSLAAGSSVEVQPALLLSNSAPVGEYIVYFRALPVQNSAAGLNIVPVAKTRVTFEVTSLSFWSALRSNILGWLLSHNEVYLILSLLLMSEAVLILRKSFLYGSGSQNENNHPKSPSRYKFG